MLSSNVIAEIERLLSEDNLSQRAIARKLGVSRGTVVAVADGRRRSLEPDCPATPAADDLRIVRCPTCGGRVYEPCQLCRVRRIRRLERLDALPFVPVDPLRPGRPPRRAA